jgi:hypothetical protein
MDSSIVYYVLKITWTFPIFVHPQTSTSLQPIVVLLNCIAYNLECEALS